MLKLFALWAIVLAALILAVVIREEKLAEEGKVPLGRLRRLWLKDERRIAPRFRVNWSVQYQHTPDPTTDIASTHDISQTGACLVVNELIDVNAWLELSIKIPEQEEPIQLRSKVLWRKELPQAPGENTRSFLIGIHFENIPTQIQAQIAEALPEIAA